MRVFDNRISIESKPLLEPYLMGFPYETASMSFSSLFMWRNVNKISWEIVGDYLCVAAIDVTENGTEYPLLYAPFTKDGKYDHEKLKSCLSRVRAIFKEHGWAFTLRIVPEQLLPLYKEIFGDEISIEEDRNNAEYIYSVEELRELRGRAFHGKKNHLNYFRNNYEYEYLPLTREMKDEVVQFEHDFVRTKVEAPDWKAVLMLEASTIGDIFDNMEEAGYFGGVIRIDGKIEAFCIAGPLSGDTVTEHVEKANVNFRGLYQAINNEFCKNLPESIVFLNREEDMGLENLRKSKLSLNPKRMQKVYTLVLP